jgi:hypothetical protein
MAAMTWPKPGASPPWPGGEVEAQGSATAVYGQVDLRGQPAAETANGVVDRLAGQCPFLRAPAASRAVNTRTQVPSKVGAPTANRSGSSTRSRRSLVGDHASGVRGPAGTAPPCSAAAVRSCRCRAGCGMRPMRGLFSAAPSERRSPSPPSVSPCGPGPTSYVAAHPPAPAIVPRSCRGTCRIRCSRSPSPARTIPGCTPRSPNGTASGLWSPSTRGWCCARGGSARRRPRPSSRLPPSVNP